jgi:hypothetical protein
MRMGEERDVRKAVMPDHKLIREGSIYMGPGRWGTARCVNISRNGAGTGPGVHTLDFGSKHRNLNFFLFVGGGDSLRVRI